MAQVDLVPSIQIGISELFLFHLLEGYNLFLIFAFKMYAVHLTCIESLVANL